MTILLPSPVNQDRACTLPPTDARRDNETTQFRHHMKIRMLLSLLAIAAAEPAAAEPCSTVASRNTIAETLRRAAEDRPVNLTFQTRAEGVKMSDNLKSKYPDA